MYSDKFERFGQLFIDPLDGEIVILLGFDEKNKRYEAYSSKSERITAYNVYEKEILACSWNLVALFNHEDT